MGSAINWSISADGSDGCAAARSQQSSMLSLTLLENLIILQISLHQLYCGVDESPTELALRLEELALDPPLEVAIDARGVYDAIEASDCADPGECSLKLLLLSVRDRLAHGQISTLWWVDTRSMLADGLTKGGVERTLLELAS